MTSKFSHFADEALPAVVDAELGMRLCRELSIMVARYAGVGAVCAGLNLAIMYFGHQVAGLHYQLAALLTCVITIPLSYAFHQEFTYKGRSRGEPNRFRFIKFIVAQLVQFSGGFLLLIVLVEKGGMPPMWGMFTATVLMFIYGFVSSSTWVFRAFGTRRS